MEIHKKQCLLILPMIWQCGCQTCGSKMELHLVKKCLCASQICDWTLICPQPDLLLTVHCPQSPLAVSLTLCERIKAQLVVCAVFSLPVFSLSSILVCLLPHCSVFVVSQAKSACAKKRIWMIDEAYIERTIPKNTHDFLPLTVHSCSDAYCIVHVAQTQTNMLLFL